MTLSGVWTSVGRRRLEEARSLQALVSANVRYWPTVAPIVRQELDRCEALASAIPDAALRGLALAKLRDESFNAEVAATLAVLAPAPARIHAIRTIVSLEVLFDYLDGRTETLVGNVVDDGMSLFRAFTEALVPDTPAQRDGHLMRLHLSPDAAYLTALSERARESWLLLPGTSEVAAVAHASAARCARAQTRLHASFTLGDGQLEKWAREQTLDSELDWREYVSGSASSVLAVHALVAAAADPRTTREDAERIDAAYLAMGGIVTILDSLVDHADDLARGEPGLIRLFKTPDELAERLLGLTRMARVRATKAPHGDHHLMTLAGVAAYYTTHPGAKDPPARRAIKELRGELSPVIWPALVVMGCWRGVKRMRAL